MFLVDTNVWLERLLDQEKSKEVGNFLNAISSERLFITDFAFHSIALVLSKLDKVEALMQFIQDAFVEGAVRLVHLEPADMGRIIEVMCEFKLDFDDAYQYVTAEKYNLTLISFDADFERTRLGRKTPGEILAASR